MKNRLYWEYNLPLQVLPDEDSNEVLIGNYMPRKGHFNWIDLDEARKDQTREEFLETAALMLESIAKQMRMAAKNDKHSVVYPCDGFDFGEDESEQKGGGA
jgi:hypothetical protein